MFNSIGSHHLKIILKQHRIHKTPPPFSGIVPRFIASYFIASVALSLFPFLTNAATLQSNVHITSANFVAGSNITDDQPALHLSADISFDQGSFFGADCFASSVGSERGLPSGCDAYIGHFHALNKHTAFAIAATHHAYSDGFNREWNYTDLNATWHINKNASLSLIYADNWFNRPFDTVTLEHKSRFKLSNALSANILASVMAIESGAPVDYIHFAKLSLKYERERWAFEPAINISDRDLRKMVPFDVDQPDLSLTISYRLY